MAKKSEPTPEKAAPAPRKASTGAAPRAWNILDSRTGLVVDQKTGTKNQVRKLCAKSMKLGTWQLRQV